MVGASALPFISSNVVYAPVHHAEAYVAVVEPLPEAPEAPRSVESLISDISAEHGVSSTTLWNLVRWESNFDPKANGDNGCSRGLVQINLCVHDHITLTQAEDPTFALSFAASHIAAGAEWHWSVCSCVKGARNLGLNLPPIRTPADLPSNSSPKIGGGVLLSYGDTPHIAVISEVTELGMNVREFNYKPCAYTERFIPFDSPSIRGFWSPVEAP